MTDFEKVYAEHFSDVYRYVLSLCKNESVAEDITQDTFFKALKNIDNFNGTCKLYVWLCQIAKHTYFNYTKKHKNLGLLDDEAIPASSDIEKEIQDKDEVRRMHTILHHLDEPYKEVFTLRIFGDLPFSQIGELFGKTDSWARLIFYRAKKKVQEEMK